MASTPPPTASGLVGLAGCENFWFFGTLLANLRDRVQPHCSVKLAAELKFRVAGSASYVRARPRYALLGGCYRVSGLWGFSR